MDLSIRKAIAAFIIVAPVVTFVAGAGAGVPIDVVFIRASVAFVVSVVVSLPVGIVVDRLWDR